MDADLQIAELRFELAEPLMEFRDDGADEIDSKWALGLVLPLSS